MKHWAQKGKMLQMEETTTFGLNILDCCLLYIFGLLERLQPPDYCYGALKTIWGKKQHKQNVQALKPSMLCSSCCKLEEKNICIYMACEMLTRSSPCLACPWLGRFTDQAIELFLNPQQNRS